MARLNNENVNHIKMETKKKNSLSDQQIPEKINNRCGLLHAIDNFMFMCMIEKTCL